jgi:hypothetical protein
MWRWVFVCLSSAAVAGCHDACVRRSDCAPGYECVAGRCLPPDGPADGAAPDAPVPDSSFDGVIYDGPVDGAPNDSTADAPADAARDGGTDA